MVHGLKQRSIRQMLFLSYPFMCRQGEICRITSAEQSSSSRAWTTTAASPAVGFPSRRYGDIQGETPPRQHHDTRRVFLSDERNDNELDCIVSKFNIVQVLYFLIFYAPCYSSIQKPRLNWRLTRTYISTLHIASPTPLLQISHKVIAAPIPNSQPWLCFA